MSGSKQQEIESIAIALGVGWVIYGLVGWSKKVKKVINQKKPWRSIEKLTHEAAKASKYYCN